MLFAKMGNFFGSRTVWKLVLSAWIRFRNMRLLAPCTPISKPSPLMYPYRTAGERTPCPDAWAPKVPRQERRFERKPAPEPLMVIRRD